ncbi:MAG TPA: hypothetical protein VFU43_14620 [Streptosporangiaceae bacterium]|nr:hypothetical protein [Streptosporangiaceae bacterium]
MAISHLGPLVRVTAPVAMVVLLAGCGKSDSAAAPDVDQVGHTLLNQVYKMLYATDSADSKVTDALNDKYVPCGDGKVRLTYAVTARTTSFATNTVAFTNPKAKKTATPQRIIDDLLAFLPEVGTFKVVERADNGTTAKLVNAETFTRLTLHSPATDQLMISGETDCLKANASRSK